MALETDMSNRLLVDAPAALPDWNTIYVEQLPRIYNYFRYRIGNDTVAEDLTSLTFEKAWRARHRYRHDLAAFGTWLLTIARNVGTDYGRSRREYVGLDAAEEVPDSDTPEDEQSRRSDRDRLAALLEELPEREREILALKYGAGATNRAIAELTQLTQSNVGTIIHRAVQKLRSEW